MPDQTIHILMTGARRTGKSSVLASMINSFKTVAKDTNFKLTPDKSTSSFLDLKLINLRQVIDEHWGEESFTIDEKPTAYPDDYTFSVSYQEKNETREIATLEFHDVPGEDLGSDETARQIKRASVLLVAVDTVHLMEEGGKFSSVFHKPKELRNVVESGGFASEDGGIEPKMVLFVPLKCEKYYVGGQMGEVAKRVEQEFSELIEYLTKPIFKDRITIAITPILTMGSLAFDHFGRDENGKVIRQKMKGKQDNMRPAQVYYKFIGDKTFRPEYCEQPVLYILSFAVSSAQKAKKEAKPKRKLLARTIKTIYYLAKYALLFATLGPVYMAIWMLMDSQDFLKSYKEITVSLKKVGDGYKMLQNPLNM